jgi:hypothetical protein
MAFSSKNQQEKKNTLLPFRWLRESTLALITVPMSLTEDGAKQTAFSGSPTEGQMVFSSSFPMNHTQIFMIQQKVGVRFGSARTLSNPFTDIFVDYRIPMACELLTALKHFAQPLK